MRILIVGAGISGLALSQRLSHSEHEITIIEKQSGPSMDGAGICLPANAVMGIERLGLHKALMDIAHPVNSIEYAKADGTTLARASLKEPPLNQAAFVALQRSELLNLLRRTNPVPVTYGRTLVKLSTSAHGSQVVLDDGREENYDLVVAADGIHSAAREQVLPAQKPRPLGVSHWRFLAANNGTTPEPVYYIGNDDAFMIYPMPQNQVYCYGQKADSDGRWRAQDSRQALATLFGHYHAHVQEKLAQLTPAQPIMGGALQSVNVIQAYHQRVVLVGDALHGCPPSLQQGVGLGLEDIHLLADLLTGQPVEQALESYQHQRLPRVTWVVEESNRIIRLAAKGKHWPARLLRNAMIRRKGPANVVGWRRLLSDTVPAVAGATGN